MSWVPITPAGTICAGLESNTEKGAWEKLMIDAAHMPYKTQADFETRGYTVEELEEP